MIRAHIVNDYPGNGIAVFVTRRFNDRAELAGRGEFGQTIWTPLNENAAFSHDQQPTYRIPNEIAAAVLEALANHHGGVGDTRQLRQDYLAERARVDKLIGFLTEASR